MGFFNSFKKQKAETVPTGERAETRRREIFQRMSDIEKLLTVNGLFESLAEFRRAKDEIGNPARSLTDEQLNAVEAILDEIAGHTNETFSAYVNRRIARVHAAIKGVLRTEDPQIEKIEDVEDKVAEQAAFLRAFNEQLAGLDREIGKALDNNDEVTWRALVSRKKSVQSSYDVTMKSYNDLLTLYRNLNVERDMQASRQTADVLEAKAVDVVSVQYNAEISREASEQIKRTDEELSDLVAQSMAVSDDEFAFARAKEERLRMSEMAEEDPASIIVK